MHGFVDLEPARYRFRLRALTAEGRTRLLLPATHVVSFRGEVRARATIDLLPAGSIEIGVIERETGEILGPGLSVALFLPNGQRRTTRWIAVDRSPSTIATGTLPVAELCELAEAIRPGTYIVHVSGRGLDERRQIAVVAGRCLRVVLR